MIKVSDYYKKNHSSIANLDKFADVSPCSDVFPFEGLYIGEFESVTGHKLPALLSFEEINGLCFLSNSTNRQYINKMIQSIVLRFVASLPLELCRFFLYDGTGLGANLITLSNLNSQITGGEIITESQALLKALRDIQSHIPNVIQKVLGYKYSDKTLIEFNSISKEKTVPYNFLVITDYPRSFSREHFESLQMILKNCKKAGVFVIMSMDTSYVNSNTYDEIPFMYILNDMTTIYQKGERYYITHTKYDDLYRKFKLKLDANFLDDIENILEYIKAKETVTKKIECVNLIDYIPTNNHWWKRNSATELSIPFGVTPNSDVVNLSITQTSGKNVAVTVGISGSGKSVFLNTIIISAAIHYSPDELDLYLIDFSGVEFNIYADEVLPHAKVIAPESERELGISVLREIDEEGVRRQKLFSKAGVNNITDYRKKNPTEALPRILVIIDEFQKIFENDIDSISYEAETIIHNIVKEYRKFGINLILATQTINNYTNKIGLGMIANRIVFEWNDDDSHCLFVGQPPTQMISEVGDCVYNDNLGKVKNHIQTKCYNVTLDQIRPILKQLSEKATSQKIKDKELFVFRSNAKSYFLDNKNITKIEKCDIPGKVRVYLGEPIAISEDHVYIELQHNVNANILIIGGSGHDTALRIAINCVKSLLLCHNDNKATFVFLNFMQNENALFKKPNELYGNIPFTHEFIETNGQLEYLEKIKTEIERRQSSPLIKRRHIFISIYSYEFAYSFRKSGDWGDMSECGKILSYILEHGPLVGIFTILQVSELSSLKKSLESPLSFFNHRIALQMSEDDSRDVLNSAIASKLYDKRRSCSENRAYYYNNSNNSIVKFKPYEI